MQKSGILNPDLLHLLARIRHTNTLVIADRGFPFWPEIETVDISLVDGIPSVLQVINALRASYDFTEAFMAQEFLGENTPEVLVVLRNRAFYLEADGQFPAQAQ